METNISMENMETSISMETDRAAEKMADSGLRTFREEIRPLSDHVSGVTVRMEEGGSGNGGPTKSIRVNVDLRSGGRYLIEAEGEDWEGLIRSTAERTKRGVERELSERWEMP